ncbi:MAG: four helix bundle protein [Acidobacteria bacterium]|nr:four helix bundle protein [Acidobacteriota bacterium]
MNDRGSARDAERRAEGANGKKSVKSYKDLLVWQKGITLVKKIYELTRNFPDAEKFGVVSQMRRAAVSVPSNIAEGQARHTRKEFIQFLSHSEGSVAELETQVILGVELGFCALADTQEITTLTTELSKMLDSLRRRLEAKD